MENRELDDIAGGEGDKGAGGEAEFEEAFGGDGVADAVEGFVGEVDGDGFLFIGEEGLEAGLEGGKAFVLELVEVGDK